MARNKAWNGTEIRGCVRLYIRMKRHVVKGEKYNKAAMIREVQGTSLKDRSRGSIEAKLMNITACLNDLGRNDLSMELHGYKAAPNYQRALLDMVRDVLTEEAI